MRKETNKYLQGNIFVLTGNLIAVSGKDEKKTVFRETVDLNRKINDYILKRIDKIYSSWSTYAISAGST